MEIRFRITIHHRKNNHTIEALTEPFSCNEADIDIERQCLIESIAEQIGCSEADVDVEVLEEKTK